MSNWCRLKVPCNITYHPAARMYSIFSTEADTALGISRVGNKATPRGYFYSKQIENNTTTGVIQYSRRRAPFITPGVTTRKKQIRKFTFFFYHGTIIYPIQLTTPFCSSVRVEAVFYHDHLLWRSLWFQGAHPATWCVIWVSISISSE